MKRNQDVSLGRQLKTTYPKSLLLIYVDLVDYWAQLRQSQTNIAAGRSAQVHQFHYPHPTFHHHFRTLLLHIYI